MSFTTIEVIFLQRLVADRPVSRAGGASASFFCSDFGLGLAVGRRVEYQADHYEAAQRLLLAHDLPVETLGPQASRHDSAQYGGLSEKVFSLAPHSNSVSIKVIGNCLLDGHALHTPPGTHLVVTTEQAMSISCQRILLVENFLTFRWLESYTWLDAKGFDVLVIYRGDKDAALYEAAQVIAGRPERIWSFTDFDPAGLAMANALPQDRLETIVLPSNEQLTLAAHRSARGMDLYDKQENQYLATLDASANKLVQPVWALLKKLRCGVTQERMWSIR